MHSHHSHSGDYVSHATDNLEEVVKKAEDMGFTHFCLTEHMPRLEDSFLYPEEIDKGYSCENLESNFSNYLVHAKKIQQEYTARKSSLQVLVGYEVEGLNTAHIKYSKALAEKHRDVLNMSVGSVHHVNEIPIDFSPELWLNSMQLSPEKSPRSLFLQYYQLQHEVISELHPKVIGHFDLIRLFEPLDLVDKSTQKLVKDIEIETDWPEVWDQIVTNIKIVQSYGGLFELNSAAIRKGWDSPYPKVDVAKAIIQYGDGKFCLSDDSHAIKQVGLNYHKVWAYIISLGLEHIYHLEVDEKGDTLVKKDSVAELSKSKFWHQYTLI